MNHARSAFSGNFRLKGIAGKSITALLIKVASAGLTFLMFMAIARSMSRADAGVFGFGYALATFLALVVGLGLKTLALRMVPVYRADNELGHLRGLLLWSYAAIAAASAIVAIGLCAIAMSGGHSRVYLISVAALVLVMAIADYQQCVLRGSGSVTAALLPRDVLYRAGLVLACAPAVLGLTALPTGRGLTPVVALGIAALLLFGLILAQFLLNSFVRNLVLKGCRPIFTPRSWRRTATGMWGNTVLQSGFQHAAVVLSGLVLAPAVLAGLFAALKAALLLNFFLVAANLVVAPYVSRLWHRGDLERLRRICAGVTIGAAIPTIASFVLYVVAGRHVLSLFGDGYAEFYPTLLILAGSQVVNSLCGQTGIILTMTGHERTQLKFVAVSNIVPLALLPLVASAFGNVYAAVAIAIGLSLWNVQAVFWSKRNLSIDTSIVGAVSEFARRR